MKSDPNYYGFPGGRPVWPFDKIKKPAPKPVTVPTVRHGVSILRLVAKGVNTRRTIAAALGFKAVESVARHIKALDHGGYIRRTSNNGRDVRIVRLTDKGRKALEKLLGPDWQTSHREVRAEYERLQAMKSIRDNDQPTPKP